MAWSLCLEYKHGLVEVEIDLIPPYSVSWQQHYFLVCGAKVLKIMRILNNLFSFQSGGNFNFKIVQNFISEQKKLDKVINKKHCYLPRERTQLI